MVRGRLSRKAMQELSDLEIPAVADPKRMRREGREIWGIHLSVLMEQRSYGAFSEREEQLLVNPSNNLERGEEPNQAKEKKRRNKKKNLGLGL